MTLEDVLGVYAAARRRPSRSSASTPATRSIYGAIGEQIDWCLAHERSWEIVPGVSSVAAAAAVLGRELTQPGVSQSVVLTRLAGRTPASMPAGEGVAAVRRPRRHHGRVPVRRPARRAARPSCWPPAPATTEHTPAAIVIRATWPDERVVRPPSAAWPTTCGPPARP